MREPAPNPPNHTEAWLTAAGLARVAWMAAAVVLCGSAAFLLLLPDLSLASDYRLIGPALLIPLSTVCLVLLHRKRPVAALHVLIWGAWLTTTVSAIWVAGLRTALVFAYPAIVFAALMLGRRAVIGTGVASIAVIAALGFAEHAQLLPAPRLVSLFTLTMIYVLVMLVVTTLGAVIAQEQRRWRRNENEARDKLARQAGQLAEREHALRIVIDNVPAMIVRIDRRMHCIFANARYAAFFGHTQESIAGRHIREVVGDAAFEEIRGNLERALAGERVTYHRVTAGQRHIEVSIVPESTDAGITGVCALLSDITERQRAEEEIVRLNTELEQRVVARTADLSAANRELESFAYSISHDLRAPLRGIDGFSQLLLDEYRDRLDEQGRGYLDRVRRAAQRMGTLIDDILELSRVSRQPMRRDRVDLSRLAHDIADELGRAAPQRLVALRLMPGCCARGDPQLLRLLLQNLLENAWKYTGKTAQARIEFGCESHGGETVFHVRDNGVGFDMRYADRLFAPFQRLHGADEFEGTGIGLATVARIAQRHGGRVWAEAAVGQGATFRFTLGTGD